MRTYRSNSGPFIERPYYTLEEIERICSDALRKVELFPDSPEPIRIDRFIEKRFNVTPEYKDLGPGVLGMAQFGKNGVQGIIVSQSLDEESSVTNDRRIRSTLAHEGGHGLLHTHLFAFASDQLLFGENTPTGPVVLCRDSPDAAKASTYSGQWWEFQANKAIGSLLLPRFLVLEALDKYMVDCGNLGLKSLDKANQENAIEELADVFDVNQIVASIRISELFPENQSNQMML